MNNDVIDLNSDVSIPIVSPGMVGACREIDINKLLTPSKDTKTDSKIPMKSIYKQKLVNTFNRDTFTLEVNALLEDGWKVIPGTIAMSGCKAPGDFMESVSYIAFFERYINE